MVEANQKPKGGELVQCWKSGFENGRVPGHEGEVQELGVRWGWGG